MPNVLKLETNRESEKDGGCRDGGQKETNGSGFEIRKEGRTGSNRKIAVCEKERAMKAPTLYLHGITWCVLYQSVLGGLGVDGQAQTPKSKRLERATYPRGPRDPAGMLGCFRCLGLTRCDL